jgi:predicted HNH restriction endonuclease
MIPKGLTDEHFQQAAAQIDREGIIARRESVHYDLVLNGKRYPPKYVLFLATQFAHGHPPDDFNAIEARDYFRSRGYKVIDRREEAKQFIVEEDDESNFPEGRERFRQHRYLERDGTISRKAKAKRLADTGKLQCEVCEVDFTQIYGLMGTGFIEAHHVKPVSTIHGEEKTKISNLALVCSNCHRMLHRGNHLFNVKELKKIVDDRRLELGLVS